MTKHLTSFGGSAVDIAKYFEQEQGQAAAAASGPAGAIGAICWGRSSRKRSCRGC